MQRLRLLFLLKKIVWKIREEHFIFDSEMFILTGHKKFTIMVGLHIFCIGAERFVPTLTILKGGVPSTRTLCDVMDMVLYFIEERTKHLSKTHIAQVGGRVW